MCESIYYVYFNKRHVLNCPITGLERPLGLQEVEVSTISGQSVHEGGKVVNPAFNPQEISLVLILRRD